MSEKINCPECQYEIGPHIRLCPNCGTLLERPAGERTQPIKKSSPPRPGGLRRPATTTLLIAAFALLMVTLVIASTAAGFYAGLDDRELKARRNLVEHYERGTQHLAARDYELASAEFEYVLQLQPEYPGAREKLAETRRRLTVIPTPTTSVTVTNIVDELYQQAVQAYQAQEWPLAVERLRQVRAVDAAHEPAAVEEMLFTATLTQGKLLLDGDQLEEGLYYLDLAAELRPLDQEVTSQRQLAAMYLTARGYWGADWEKAIERFSELCNVAPGYKDAYSRLWEAYISYGDHFSNTMDFCPAEQQYVQAIRVQANPTVEAKRAVAAERCLQATPVPVSGTLTVSGTIVPIPGLSSGRLAYPVYNPRSGLYDTYVLFAAENRMLKAVTSGSQPAWRPGAPELAYRVTGLGINIYNLATDEDRRVVGDSTAAWPSWSPQGDRLAYAAKDSSGSWRVFIMSMDGGQEAHVVAAGWAPAWSPSGVLAYTGCGAGGVCGIFIINPDQPGSPPTKMTGERNDTPIAWSPDGQNLAYMSDYGGNWDAFVMNISGGVAQLTNDPADDGWPAWAPDGSGLLFFSKRSGKWDLWLMNLDGSNQRLVLSLSDRSPNWTDERLSWSP
jgi:Tol biopolymer transport system component/tetratricopeptide (TPR) repeat protein